MPELGDESGHPLNRDLYTPWTPELGELFNRMKAEHGTWRQVAALSETRLKVLRNLRQGKRKAVSQRLIDRLCTTTGVGGTHEFTWFTAQDLVALGIWEPPMFIRGHFERSQGGHEWTTTKEEMKLAKRRKARRARQVAYHRKRKERAAYNAEREKWQLPEGWAPTRYLDAKPPRK